MRGRVAGTAAIAGAAAAAAAAVSASPQERTRTRAVFEAVGRAATLVGVVGVIALDYKMLARRAGDDGEELARSRIRAAEQDLIAKDKVAKAAEQRFSALFAANALGSEQRRAAEEEAQRTMQVAAEAAETLVRAKKEGAQQSGAAEIEEVHQRAADRLLWLARANKGVYIKLAQHLSQLDYLLPDAYTTTLRACLDDAPRSAWTDVCATVEEELGQHPKDLFYTFEQEPIASASLAQVHVAYLKDANGDKGHKVAVKVQVRTSRA